MSEVTLKLAWRFTTCLQQCFADMNLAEMAPNPLKRMRSLDRRISIAFLFAIAIIWIAPAMRASTDTGTEISAMSLEQYEADLDRISSVVLKFPDDGSGVGALRDSLPTTWAVTVNGTRFEVSAAWLKGTLNTIEENLKDWKKQCGRSADDLRNLCKENEEDEIFKTVKKRCEESPAPWQNLCGEKSDGEIRKVLNKQCEEAGGEPKPLCDEYGLLQSLLSWRGDCFQLAGQLKELHKEAERLAGAARSADDSGARAKLAKILSAREFQGMRSGETWIGRMWDQIQRWISWILDHTIGRLMNSDPARKLVLWLLIGGVFVVIALWVVRILSRMARTEALRVEGSFLPGRNWRQWAQEALAAGRAGDYRTALHSAYWAGVYRLADSGAWRLDQARTPREYLRLLRSPVGRQVSYSASEPAGGADRVSALAALTRSMESTWYGYIPATEQDFESAMDQLERLGCKLRSTAQTANS
jgi:hypothetical protein